jgi:hypothetical protein
MATVGRPNERSIVDSVVESVEESVGEPIEGSTMESVG